MEIPFKLINIHLHQSISSKIGLENMKKIFKIEQIKILFQDKKKKFLISLKCKNKRDTISTWIINFKVLLINKTKIYLENLEN